MKTALTILLLIGISGCGTFVTSAKDRQVFDHRAKTMRIVADKLNADDFLDKASIAYVIECEARAAQNLADTAHYRRPTFTEPLLPPATLPWYPNAEPTTQPGGN